MAWQRNYVTLTEGKRVRYAFFTKPDSPAYCVRFKGKSGSYMRLSTGQVKKPDAIEEAHRLIREHYEGTAVATGVTWAEAKDKLETALAADNKRPKTISGYKETLARLIGLFPFTKGPADITEELAEDFKTQYAGGRFSRKPTKQGESVPTYARKTKSLDSRLRTLKAIFSWFKQMRLVAGNPFTKVTQPEMDRHEVKYVRQEDLADFMEWLEKRYPGWQMPLLFFSVKAVTGCRLEDITSLRADQLHEGRLTFEADQTKNRSERYAILPDDIYAELEAYKGKTFLWERYPAELRAHTKSASRHQVIEEFSSKRLYTWIVALMRDYQQQTGSDLSSHDFRKAAFTRAAEADIHPKRAAVAFDVTAETMLKYYTATEKKRTSDDVLRELEGKLRPAKKPENDPNGRGR